MLPIYRCISAFLLTETYRKFRLFTMERYTVLKITIPWSENGIEWEVGNVAARFVISAKHV